MCWSRWEEDPRATALLRLSLGRGTDAGDVRLAAEAVISAIDLAVAPATAARR